MLLDKFNRKHDYLRISLTDNCNLRCTYCMPNEDIDFLSNRKLMLPSEIYEIAEVFVRLGVNKIRLTGGEPLFRKDFASIIELLSKLPVELTLTSNGILIHKYLDVLKAAGLRSINISLDTLNRTKYIQIAKRDSFDQVWNNIMSLLEHKFSVKVNIVAMKGVNEDEVVDFVALTQKYPLHIRFIEFMPFDKNGWNKDKVLRTDEMLEMIQLDQDYIKLIDAKHETSKKYKLINSLGTFAFITTMSEPFCGDCNRLRLTADGKMKNCLFGKDELDILNALRAQKDIVPIIQKSVMLKHEKLGGQFDESYLQTDASQIENRSMIKIGG